MSGTGDSGTGCQHSYLNLNSSFTTTPIGTIRVRKETKARVGQQISEAVTSYEYLSSKYQKIISALSVDKEILQTNNTKFSKPIMFTNI